jgi:hypothetical protein
VGGLFDDLYLTSSYYLLVVLHICITFLYAIALYILCMYSSLNIYLVVLSFIELD